MTSVLILDDREADRGLLSTVLGYAGYEVLEAEDADQALELARAQRPDLIISDILMPGTNGYEFVRRLREDREIGGTLVMFATANYVEGEVRRLAEACGVHHFLEKPCEPQLVIAKVGEAVGSDRPSPEPVERGEFDREQLNVLNDKLVEKVAELEEVSSARRELIVQLLNAQEDERRRIATAIHDDPIQTVSAVSMRLDTLASQLGPEHRDALEQLRRDASRAVSDLRELVFELEPVALRSQGMRVALESYLEQGREMGLDFELEMPGAGPTDEASRVMLYRMTREAVANVRKHADASRVRVSLEADPGTWTVQVSDDGRGFDPGEAFQIRPGHLGLASMREQLETAGGSLRVESTEGRGSTVTIKLPMLTEGAPREPALR